MLQQQYAATEQAVAQRQTALSSEVEQRASAIQGEAQQLEGDAQVRWASLQGDAHTTMGMLNTQAAELCADAQQQAQAFLDNFDPLITDAQAAWQKIQDGAKQGWDGLMQQAQPMLDTLKSKWSEFSSWFSSEAWPVIQQKATELGQFVSGQATQAWGWLQEQWGNLTDAWNNAESIIQSKADAARTWIAGRVEAAQVWVGGKADAARAWIGDKADAARAWIGDKADAARTWIGDKADAARAWIGDKADAARTWIGDKSDAARLWMGEKADSARTWIGEKGDAARLWIGEKGEAARSWIDDKSAVAQQWLQGRAASITATFRETGNGLVSGLAGKARGAVSAITSGGGPILEWFGSIVNRLIGGVERAGHGAVNLASGALSGGLGVVERAASGAVRGLSGMASGAVNTVQGAATGAVNTVQGAATGAVNGVETLGNGAVTAVEGAATTAVNGVETLATGAVNTVEGAATTAVNGVQSLGSSAVTFVEGRAQGAVDTVETAVNGAVGAVGVVGQGVVTGLEQQALGAMSLARAAWDDIQRTWNAAARTAGQVLGWLGEQAGRLGNWLSTEVFPRVSQWAGEQWTHLSGWVAEQFPALAACWKAFEQFAEAAWAKVQQVPLVGDYLRISGELLEGMIAGDALQNPTAMNIVGQVLIGFTPIGWAGDARDIGLALYRLAKGEGSGVDALIAVAAIVPGLDALKGLKGGAKLLDHADEAAEGLKLLQDALKGLPPGLTDGILKNPELMAQLAKNPGLLEEVIRRGDEGVEAFAKGGEDGLATLKGVDVPSGRVSGGDGRPSHESGTASSSLPNRELENSSVPGATDTPDFRERIQSDKLEIDSFSSHTDPVKGANLSEVLASKEFHRQGSGTFTNFQSSGSRRSSEELKAAIDRLQSIDYVDREIVNQLADLRNMIENLDEALQRDEITEIRANAFRFQFQRELELFEEWEQIGDLHWPRGTEPASPEMLEWIASLRKTNGDSLKLMMVTRKQFDDWMYWQAGKTNAGMASGNPEIYYRPDPRKIELLEEVLHHVQEMIPGFANQFPYPVNEFHVKDFMIRHRDKFNLTPEDVEELQKMMIDQMNSGKDQMGNELQLPPSARRLSLRQPIMGGTDRFLDMSFDDLFDLMLNDIESGVMWKETTEDKVLGFKEWISEKIKRRS